MKQAARLERVLLANVLLTLLLLGALELGFRTFGEPRKPIVRGKLLFNETQAAPYLVFHPQPNADVMVDSEQQRQRGRRETHIVTDRHGFRYAGDLREPKGARELRVFVLGGSVVFRGLSNATTIPAHLERKLSRSLAGADRVRCVNAGIVAAVSDQELAVLVHDVADLEPDLVVVFDGFNDIWSRAVLEPRIGYPFQWWLVEDLHERFVEERDLLKVSIEELPLWKIAFAKSRLVTHFSPRFRLENQLTARVARAAAQEYPRPPGRDVAEHLLRNWRKMHRFSGAVGAELVAILQPPAPGDRGPRFQAFYDHMNAEIERAQREGEPFYSFDHLLDDHPEYFYDEVHTWDEAHEIYAERIFSLLVEHGSLKRWER